LWKFAEGVKAPNAKGDTGELILHIFYNISSH